MEPVNVISSIAVPLLRDNIDTDQIIPATWMVRTEATGYEDGLFERLREDPSFVLNDRRYDGAQILVAGRNFGCGSSREHAPWALRDYGFRAVVAATFADIHRGNLANVGLVPAEVGYSTARQIAEVCEHDPTTVVRVDLASAQVQVPSVGLSCDLVIEPAAQRRLLAGQDLIDETLRHTDAIAAFEKTRPSWMPALNPPDLAS